MYVQRVTQVPCNHHHGMCAALARVLHTGWQSAAAVSSRCCRTCGPVGRGGTGMAGKAVVGAATAVVGP